MEKIFQSISGNNTLMYKKSLFWHLCVVVFSIPIAIIRKKSALFVNLSGNIFQLQASYSWGLWKSQSISFR